jgi:hypothetical protein
MLGIDMGNQRHMLCRDFANRTYVVGVGLVDQCWEPFVRDVTITKYQRMRSGRRVAGDEQ